MIGLGKAASKAFGWGTLEIPEVDLGRTRGSKPQMAGTTGVPFWINLGNNSAIAGNAKIKRVKPSMTGMVCHFFGAGALEPTGDSEIPSILI